MVSHPLRAAAARSLSHTAVRGAVQVLCDMVTTAERAAAVEAGGGGSGSSPTRAGAVGKAGPYKARRGVVDPAAEALRALRALLKDKGAAPLPPADTAAASALLVDSLTPLVTSAAAGGACCLWGGCGRVGTVHSLLQAPAWLPPSQP